MNIKIAVLEKKEDIPLFCEYIEEYKYIDNNLADKVERLIELIGFPCSIVCEFEYVDKIYRDTYYHYFAGKHNPYDRNCKRLSFFKGVLDNNIFYDYSDAGQSFLQDLFVGTMILKPIENGKIGRTLIDATKLKIEKACVRLTKFDVVIAGHLFSIQAFPYSSQDAETMTCAETTVWSLLEYFGNRYDTYRTVLPSEIYAELSRFSNERVWPSKGLAYEKVSELLKTFGFSPRIYALESYVDGNRENFINCDEYKHIFHYYVESGIPFAVGITASKPDKIEHSMVCIGHTCKKKDLSLIKREYIGKIPYIDTADYYDEYVMIDDNRIPYVIDNYMDISFYGENTYIDVLAIPLYKRILMEAADARTIIEELLNFEDYNFNAFLEEHKDIIISEDNPVTVRVFLTSSRKYKKFRATNASSKCEAEFYANGLYPKFLWVAEISRHSDYLKNKIYGEIVLDATAAVSGLNEGYENSVILIRYFSHVGYTEKKAQKKKYIDENRRVYEVFASRFDNILDELESEAIGFSSSFPLYINNLLSIGD